MTQKNFHLSTARACPGETHRCDGSSIKTFHNFSQTFDKKMLPFFYNTVRIASYIILVVKNSISFGELTDRI